MRGKKKKKKTHHQKHKNNKTKLLLRPLLFILPKVFFKEMIVFVRHGGPVGDERSTARRSDSWFVGHTFGRESASAFHKEGWASFLTI